jgi:hypothetical protein
VGIYHALPLFQLDLTLHFVDRVHEIRSSSRALFMSGESNDHPVAAWPIHNS